MNPVAQRFGRAAPRYEQYASVQRHVSERLLLTVAQRLPTPPRRILEVGCGTGLVSRPLRALWPEATMVCCDLAPAMVAHCRAGFGPDGGEHQFVVCRGEALPFSGPFDLILSSMTAQWFQAPGPILAVWRQLLAQGGCLAVALPVAGSLNEWEQALTRAGLPSGIQPFPSVADLVAAVQPVQSDVYEITTHYQQGLDFLRELKGIGGETPRSGYRPLGPLQLRRAVAAFTAAGPAVRWQIAQLFADAA